MYEMALLKSLHLKDIHHLTAMIVVIVDMVVVVQVAMMVAIVVIVVVAVVATVVAVDMVTIGGGSVCVPEVLEDIEIVMVAVVEIDPETEAVDIECCKTQ